MKRDPNGHFNLDPDCFSISTYLDLQEAIKENLKRFEDVGIFKEDLIEAYQKCGVVSVEFSDYWPMGGRWIGIDGADSAPPGFKERYGCNGYHITLKNLEPDEIRENVEKIGKPFPKGWGCKIKVEEYYRVLFFWCLTQTIPIRGRYLNQSFRDSKGEKVAEHLVAWDLARKMARQKGHEIKVSYPKVRKRKGLEFSNDVFSYQVIKNAEMIAEREKEAQALAAKTLKPHDPAVSKETVATA